MRDYLRNLLYDFTKSISKIHLLGTINDEVFNDFPNDLPETVRKKWVEKVKKLLISVENGKKDYEFSDYGFMASLIHVLPGEDKSVNFTQVILRQDLINYFAHLEALLQDIYRCIYSLKPELIPSQKEIKWGEIVSKATYDEIKKYVIEKHLEKSGFDKITDQLERLNNKPFLLKVSIKKKQFQELEKLIAIRNLILHNGSKITNDYLALVNDSSYNLGDEILLDRAYLDKVHDLFQRVAYETYASVCHEFFQIEKQKLYDEMSYSP